MKTIASVEYILHNGDKRKYYCGKVDFWTDKINPSTYIVYESSRPKQASKTNLANRREVVRKQAAQRVRLSVCLITVCAQQQPLSESARRLSIAYLVHHSTTL